jgi:integrase
MPLTERVTGWLDARAEQLPAAARDALRGLVASAPPDRLPRQLVHFDFRSANILCAGGEVTAVIDFEEARHDHRLVELARAAILLGTRYHNWRPAPAEVRTEFLAGYQSVRPLTRAEAGWLDILLLWQAMAMVPPGDDPTGWGPSALSQLPRHAIREGMVVDNPARRVEMPLARRPHAVVWTDARVGQWQQDGWRPAVAVWTTAQLTGFLGFVADDPLYPLWWLVALRGLRRGEVAGLRWQDIDLDRRQLAVVSQRTTVGYAVIECPPKSSASHRTIALDRRTVDVLHAHRQRQRRLYGGCGRVWRESGYVFTRPDGQPYHPNYLTHRLQYLIKRCGLPPVRLHDLRHGAASLAHAAGADLKTIQDQLGHASVVLTADTYTTVLPTVQHKAAEATARLILSTARGARAKIRGKNRRRESDRSPQKSTTSPPASTLAPPKRPGQDVDRSRRTRSAPRRR